MALSLNNHVEIPFIRPEFGHLIDGKWEGGATGETIDLMNPATGQRLSRIQAGSARDVERAVAAATAAFPKWSRSTPSERQALLLEIARRMKARARDYAILESMNNGKTITESSTFDVPRAIAQFELFAGAAHSLHGKSFDYPNAVGIVHREPLGVCAQIIPWNVPLIMMAGKIAPALATGNTVVLKPAETVCLAVMEFFSDMADLIPPGVINVVTGYGPAVGDPLVTHPGVRKVAFTGSVATARHLIRNAAANIIPQTLELGGKSANIVCADADIDAAVESATLTTIFNKGEICYAGSRLFLHEAIADEFMDKFRRSMERIRIGDPLDPRTQLGALSSKAQFDKVTSYFDIGRDEGAIALVGGARATGGNLDAGYFVLPTVFTNVRNDMRVAQEEIFGPVTSVLLWNDEHDVLRQANASPYGLASGLWTRDLARAHRMARGIQAGAVWVNRYYNGQINMPVGGYKQSGFGREFSWDVMEHYTQTKSVVINLEEGPVGLYTD